jgi:hypothetical protein
MKIHLSEVRFMVAPLGSRLIWLIAPDEVDANTEKVAAVVKRAHTVDHE